MSNFSTTEANVFASDGPVLVGLGRDGSADLPQVDKITVAAGDFADDRILPAFSQAEVQRYFAQSNSEDAVADYIIKVVALGCEGLSQHNFCRAAHMAVSRLLVKEMI